MDDAPRAPWVKTAMIVGLLILLGAGCATKSVAPVKPVADSSAVDSIVPTVPTSTQVVALSPTRILKGDRDQFCFDQSMDFDTFKKTVDETTKDLNTAGPIAEYITDDLQKGWQIQSFCIVPITDTSGYSPVVVTLRKSKGVTEQDLKFMKKIIGFEPQANLTPASFNGEQFWSLNELVWVGTDAREEPFGTGMFTSVSFAVNGGPNQPGEVNNLVLSNDTKTGDPLITATATGGDQDRYDATIAYKPFKDDLTTKTCVRLVDTKLGLGHYLPPVCH
jgi:hypothetical protein